MRPSLTTTIALVFALTVLFEGPSAAGPGPLHDGDEAQDSSPTTFRDCPTCPEMVVLPAGSFVMGDDQGRGDEKPAHRVEVDRPFALARHEVTFAQCEACVTAGGCDHRPDDQGWGRVARPVVAVSWHDAQQYVAWLSAVTGKPYRLPSEAEWEYAARAGSRTQYWWGDDPGDGAATYCGSQWDTKRTAIVASFPANPFGLHDIHGNTWEWTADCYAADAYAHADGTAVPRGTAEDTCRRVLRGGSWQTYPLLLRAARRYDADPAGRFADVGLRVARDLAPIARPGS